MPQPSPPTFKKNLKHPSRRRRKRQRFSFAAAADQKSSLVCQPQPPFGRGALPRSGVHWVRPELVGQVGFSEWTTAGQLRHPRFLGLRDDKDPAAVSRERPA